MGLEKENTELSRQLRGGLEFCIIISISHLLTLFNLVFIFMDLWLFIP